MLFIKHFIIVYHSSFQIKPCFEDIEIFSEKDDGKHLLPKLMPFMRDDWYILVPAFWPNRKEAIP